MFTPRIESESSKLSKNNGNDEAFKVIKSLLDGMDDDNDNVKSVITRPD